MNREGIMVMHVDPRCGARRARICGLVLLALLTTAAHADPWKRHAIDNSSQGADGVRLMDVNGDGRPDITTGWEEGGVIRVYLHPGTHHVKDPWPAVTVGRVKSPEDAVFVDLDHDGAVDVVSSCEGKTRTVFVHWAPKAKAKYLDENAWKTEAIPATQGKQMWMFCLPMQVDNERGMDLIVGSKGGNASIGWLESPTDPRDLGAWKYHRIRDAGWIMSLIARDMDGDGDLDVLYSDRKGGHRGVGWLEHPDKIDANNADARWTDRIIGGGDREVMFVAGDIFTIAKPTDILYFERRKNSPPWVARTFLFPNNTGHAKGIGVGDIDLDGHPDVVISCESATPPLSGVKWRAMPNAGVPADDATRVDGHDISGPEGVKFDLIELIDLDGDGDLDVLTCEERANLGVIWYENPTR